MKVNNKGNKEKGDLQFQVSETASIGSLIGLIPATVSNEEEFSWEDRSTSNIFDLHPKSGNITLVGNLDYEKVLKTPTQ